MNLLDDQTRSRKINEEKIREVNDEKIFDGARHMLKRREKPDYGGDMQNTEEKRIQSGSVQGAEYGIEFIYNK